MVAAIQKQNPNGPIRYLDDEDDDGRTGDGLIGYSQRYFFENKRDNPEVLVHLPMTKAAVRGLDTMTNFANTKITKFYVAGASKRGWVAWLCAAVDDRVIGLMPLVLDFLNIAKSFQNHYRSLGGWSWALKPYWKQKNTIYLTDPESYFLTDIVDPYSYREFLTMPKYVITAGSDEFFIPDNAHHYFNDMEGPTYLRIHQNTDHILIGHYRRIANEGISFIRMVQEGWKFPKLSWTRSVDASNGIITLYTDTQPINITAWRAETVTDTRRDFRWFRARQLNSSDISPQAIVYRDIGVGSPEPGIYKAVAEIPTSGWACFFIEMMFPAPEGGHITFTTEVHIIPDTLPYPPCEGLSCGGSLV